MRAPQIWEPFLHHFAPFFATSQCGFVLHQPLTTTNCTTGAISEARQPQNPIPSPLPPLHMNLLHSHFQLRTPHSPLRIPHCVAPPVKAGQASVEAAVKPESKGSQTWSRLVKPKMFFDANVTMQPCNHVTLPAFGHPSLLITPTAFCLLDGRRRLVSRR